VLDPDQWVTKYADMLFRYAYLRLADTTMAEDIVQETFLNAWRSRETYDQSSSEKNWLFTICKNKIIDHFRKPGSNRMSQIYEFSDSYYFDEHDHWTNEASPVLWNISSLPCDNQDFLTVLSRCRSKLNKTQHTVFTLRYIDEIDAHEICRMMGITVQNYWVLIHRAKVQLRECLQRNWIDL
jgi:RNA polymerase sigma-70 factor (TIGR02943 family)